MTLDLLAIGDVSIDQYMEIEDAEINGTPESADYKITFKFGSKIPVKRFSANVAGNASNNTISCTKLGMRCGVYTEFGDDGNADLFIKEFSNHNIDTTYCMKNPGSPTNVHTVLSFKDERTIFSYHHRQTYKIRDWEKPKWIYYTSVAEGFESFQEELVKYLGENPDIGVAYNPGTFHLKVGVEKLKNILSVTDVLFVNLDEAKQFVGDYPLEDLHKNLQKLGPKLTIITKGEKGSSAFDGNNLIKVGTLTDLRPVIDKTGAGDAHSAGVLAALHNNKDLETALKWGTINAASVIRQVGSINGQVSKKEIEELLNHNPSFQAVDF